MSLAGFETLRHRHPDQAEFVKRLESEIRETIERDPAALIDERVIADGLRIHRDEDLETLETMLAELVAESMLETVLLWECANGYGAALEGRSVMAFPMRLECEKCGQEHEFSADAIEVQFLPSALLLDDIKKQTDR